MREIGPFLKYMESEYNVKVGSSLCFENYLGILFNVFTMESFPLTQKVAKI